MANAPVTLKRFVEQLAVFAEHAPDAIVRINSENIDTYSITVLNPSARFGEGYGLTELGPDPARDRVLDISVNGREFEPLPVRHYPYARHSK